MAKSKHLTPQVQHFFKQTSKRLASQDKKIPIQNNSLSNHRNAMHALKGASDSTKFEAAAVYHEEKAFFKQHPSSTKLNKVDKTVASAHAMQTKPLTKGDNVLSPSGKLATITGITMHNGSPHYTLDTGEHLDAKINTLKESRDAYAASVRSQPGAQGKYIASVPKTKQEKLQALYKAVSKATTADERAAKQKGEPGAAQGGSGQHGGNPCHDSEGKFC